MQKLLFRLEAGLVWLIYHFFAALPVDAASAIGGWIARSVGPHIPVTKRARDNLRLALPDQDADKIIAAMWDNLGRCAAEFPHAETMRTDPSRLAIVGEEHVAALREQGGAALLFSGHIGNWELTYPLVARLGLQASGIYRAPNNPYMQWLFDSRVRTPNLRMFPKGAAGARETVKLLSKGESIVMFVDQKMNDGIELPFFGRPAMTAPALATLARKFALPIIPFRIMRQSGAHFRVEILPPFHVAVTEDRDSDIVAAMTKVNGILEGWIREVPAQWLWLHRRWPKKAQ